MNIILTAEQTLALQPLADDCWNDRLSSTAFARTISYKAHMIGLPIPATDSCEFYNMTCGNEPMKSVLRQLGYGVSVYGYGIYKLGIHGPAVVGCINESTWN